MLFCASLYAGPFARYTPVVAATPEGSEIVDDGAMFWGLATRLNLQLVYDGVPLDMTAEPTTDALLAVVARHAPARSEARRVGRAGVRTSRCRRRTSQLRNNTERADVTK